MDLSGAYTAIVTPFSGEALDEEGLRKNIRFQIEQGMDGVVPVGTTGECPVLSPEEHERVIDIAVEEAKGKCKVIAGSGSNSTKEAIRYTQHAKDAGADAALIVVPYYNKPSQEGLYQHYKAIAEAVDIPIVLYNVPSRTGKNLEAETTLRLSKIPNIVAVKEASCNLEQIMRILRDAPEDFIVLSGEDSWTYPMMALGGHGVISVASNIAPAKVANMVHEFFDGKLETSKAIHYELLDLFKVVFVDTNPCPVKYALDKMGFAAGAPRLPLVEMTNENKAKMDVVLSSLDLI